MEEKDTLLSNIICSACLCVGRKLQCISNIVSKQFYFAVIEELALQNHTDTEPQVCWECNALLKKIILFKQQIGECYEIIQNYKNKALAEQLFTDVSRQSHLSVHCCSPIDIVPPDSRDMLEICLVKNEEAQPNVTTGNNELASCYVKNEDKEDSYTEDNDGHDDMKEEDLSDLNDALFSDNSDSQSVKSEKVETKKRTQKAKINIKKNSTKIKIRKQSILEKVQKVENVDVDKSKVRTIELSFEDAVLERDEEAKKQNYIMSLHKCESCIIGFKYEKSYNEHIANKHSPLLGDYHCPICKTVMASIQVFTAHYKRHLRRYECTACGKRTNDRKCIIYHYNSVHIDNPKQFECNVCGKISNTLDSHKYHLGTHRRRAECKDCHKTFSHRAGLMNHRVIHKMSNERFKCSVCQKEFRWKHSLKKHMEKHNDGGANNVPICQPCGISFSSMSSYQRHLSSSMKHVTENELKFICDHCNRKFSNKTKLRDHIEEKHLLKTFSCTICNKPSKNRVCLDQHMRNVHKGRAKDKICHHCGKGFPTKVQLDSHIRSHTGEKPFICEYCPTTFSQKSNLYKHNRQVHMNIKAKRYLSRKRKEKDQPMPTSLPIFHSREIPALLYTHDKQDYIV